MSLAILLLFALMAIATACPFAAMLKAGVDRRGRPADPAALQAALDAHQAEKARVTAERKRQGMADPPPQADQVEAEFVLSSRLKSNESEVFGLGFPVGYAVDGFETPVIELIAGRTYRFKVLSACNHPFYITRDSRGKGRAPENKGFVQAPNMLEICDGESVLWRPPASLVGEELYYQCTIHDNMGNRVVVRKETTCEKYTRVHSQGINPLANSFELMREIVDNVIDNALADNRLNDYFRGGLGILPDYSMDAAAALELRDGLIAFFGETFQCLDGTVPPYEGASMAEVHKNMPITKVEYDIFNDAIADALETLFEPEDIEATIDFLNSNEVRGQICNTDPTCIETICSKYALALFPDPDNEGQKLADADEQLITAIVDDVVARIVNDSQLLPFFNGEVPAGSVDFTASAEVLQDLKDKLVSFFGKPGVLTCTQPTFPQNDEYAIADLGPTHAGMPITTEIFNLFNDKVIETANKFGVEAADQDAIRAVLDSTEPLICNQPGCSTVPEADEQFVLTVKTKPSNHHFFNQGFKSAFEINGEFVEGINLEVGKVYQFKVNSGCLHPFYISTGTGAGTPDSALAVDPEGSPICNGKTLTVTPTAADVGSTLFYACRNHNFMGGAICVRQPGDNTACAPDQAGAAKTPCDEMVDNVLAAVGGTSGNTLTDAKTILERVVVDSFTAALGTGLKKYFDGTQPAGSRDFAGDATLRLALVEGLVTFFGGALGCSDNSIGPFQGNSNMKTVHQFMNIQEDEFDLFNNVVLGNLQKVGESNAGMSAATAKKISVFLNSTSSDICAGCDDYAPPSLCEKWAGAVGVDQVSLVQDAVVAVFAAIVDPSTGLSRDFFDGSEPCEARDFVNNRLNQATLVKSLVAFFGQPNILGCTASNFPKYVGEQDMELVHKNIPINKAMFDQFGTALVNHLQQNLPSSVVPSIDDDIAAILAFYSSDAITVTCNQPDCPALRGTFVEKCPPEDTTTTTTAPVGTPSSDEPPSDEPPTDEEGDTEDSEGDTEDSEAEGEDDSAEEDAEVGDGPVGAASLVSLSAGALVAALAFRA